MVLVYDWVDTSLIQPLPRDTEFSREHNLSDRFVVLYAGNIGLSQGLEHVLTAAEILSDHPKILFLFVGDGASRESLEAQAHKRQLKNALFLPFQPRARLPEVLGTADVSLVTLRHGIGSGSLPSKTFSILASGRPILVSVDLGGRRIIKKDRSESGICVPPENPNRLAEAILMLKNDNSLREMLGSNGRKWAEQYHSPQSAAEQFEILLSKAIESKKK
jgi:colanic acid biosynthesis glycosyl transferase WcaI